MMPNEYDQWLHGSFDDLMGFQKRCFPDELIERTRTQDPWIRRKTPASEPSLL